jgi:hypothetical protein
MEITGGEPDVVFLSGELCFVDCSGESPAGRRSVCYDLEGLASRKDHPPKHNAVDMAAEMGVQLLNEMQYLELQGLEVLDRKTSSWINTPDEIRNEGGALFGDRRFGRVFIYHNGAQSYYSVRGFRALLKL